MYRLLSMIVIVGIQTGALTVSGNGTGDDDEVRLERVALIISPLSREREGGLRRLYSGHRGEGKLSSYESIRMRDLMTL